MVNQPGSILIFDRALLRQRRNNSARMLKDHGFLLDWTGDQILERLKDIKREFFCALQIGMRNTEKFSEKLCNIAQIKNLFRMDIAETLAKKNCSRTVIADEEFLPFADKSLDLAVSCLNLHATNDLPGTLIQIRRALKPDGLFLAAMFGGETLFELRQSLMHAEVLLNNGASPHIFPFAEKQQIGALMQRAGFALPVVDSDIVTVTYENMFMLMEDLRGMGENNIILERSKKYPGRDFFPEAARYYQKHFSEEDGRIRASFEIIFLIGWAPHKSQQQPLRPGSAETRLADALNTDEIKTGEKARP